MWGRLLHPRRPPLPRGGRELRGISPLRRQRWPPRPSSSRCRRAPPPLPPQMERPPPMTSSHGLRVKNGRMTADPDRAHRTAPFPAALACLAGARLAPASPPASLRLRRWRRRKPSRVPTATGMHGRNSPLSHDAVRVLLCNPRTVSAGIGSARAQRRAAAVADSSSGRSGGAPVLAPTATSLADQHPLLGAPSRVLPVPPHRRGCRRRVGPRDRDREERREAGPPQPVLCLPPRRRGRGAPEAGSQRRRGDSPEQREEGGQREPRV
jgi:hypothetical protein